MKQFTLQQQMEMCVCKKINKNQIKIVDENKNRQPFDKPQTQLKSCLMSLSDVFVHERARARVYKLTEKPKQPKKYVYVP